MGRPRSPPRRPHAGAAPDPANGPVPLPPPRRSARPPYTPRPRRLPPATLPRATPPTTGALTRRDLARGRPRHPGSGVADKIGRLDTCTSVTYTPLLCAGTEVINPILTIAREAPADADFCEDVVVRYVVSNVGTGTETDVRIEEKLPDGLRPAVDSAVETVVIPVGDLPEGRTRSFSVRLRAKSTGQYTGRAVVRGTGTEAQSQEATTTARAPKLDVSSTAPVGVSRKAASTRVVTNRRRRRRDAR